MEWQPTQDTTFSRTSLKSSNRKRLGTKTLDALMVVKGDMGRRKLMSEEAFQRFSSQDLRVQLEKPSELRKLSVIPTQKLNKWIMDCETKHILVSSSFTTNQLIHKKID